jgi:gas vesicle protein
MMAYNWKRGVMIGAALGALASLLHKETRTGAKEWGKKLLTDLKEYKEHPSKAMQDLRSTVQRIDQIASTFVHELDTAESLFTSDSKANPQQNQLH